jgi:hypothetical protein
LLAPAAAFVVGFGVLAFFALGIVVSRDLKCCAVV